MLVLNSSKFLCKSCPLMSCKPLVFLSSHSKAPLPSQEPLIINSSPYPRDSMTNVSPKILSHLDRGLHLQTGHPLALIKQRIITFMYQRFKRNRGMPAFSVHESLSPVVSLKQNFDSLLVPEAGEPVMLSLSASKKNRF